MTYDELPTAKIATFETWKSLGYCVMKGTKAVWVNGVPHFTEHQVIPFSELKQKKAEVHEKLKDESEQFEAEDRILKTYDKPDYDDDYPF